MKSYLFVYGTLTDAQIREKILGYHAPLYPARLSGFRMSTIWIAGTEYPILIEDVERGEVIQGGYFMLNPEDVLKMDAYESDAYRRKRVKLENGIHAWVYYK